MRILAIGDIHGCIDPLLDIMGQAEKDLPKIDKIIFLGDYIDRGSKGYRVLSYVKGLQEKYPDKVICLLGNHEDMLLKATVEIYPKKHSSDYYYELWTVYNGGYATVGDFKANGRDITEFNDWLLTLPLYYVSPHYVFVHGGMPKAVLEENTRDDILWDRTADFKDRKDMPRIVYGHTPHRSVLMTSSGDICLDTGMGHGGVLTAVLFDGYDIESTFTAN